MDEPDQNLSPRPNTPDLPWNGSGYGSRRGGGQQFRGPLLVVGSLLVLLVLAWQLQSLL